MAEMNKEVLEVNQKSHVDLDLYGHLQVVVCILKHPFLPGPL